MLGKRRKITIYLPEFYFLWIEDYAGKNQLSLSSAVYNLLTHHIDICRMPPDLMAEDPYTGEEVPLDMEFVRRSRQYEKDRKRQKKLAIEKAKNEGKLVELKNFKGLNCPEI